MDNGSQPRHSRSAAVDVNREGTVVMTTIARLIIAGAVATMVTGAYLIGYLPPRREVLTLRAETGRLGRQLAAAEAQIRTGGLLGELLAVTDAAVARNYQDARTGAVRFFDAVRAETDRSSGARRAALTRVLQRRDPATTALARGDAAALDQLRESMVLLRHALGYRVGDDEEAFR
jgi:hypothetical protein